MNQELKKLEELIQATWDLGNKIASEQAKKQVSDKEWWTSSARGREFAALSDATWQLMHNITSIENASDDVLSGDDFNKLWEREKTRTEITVLGNSLRLI